MKFWYYPISAIFLFVLFFNNLEQLQNALMFQNQEISQLISCNEQQNWHFSNTPEEKQERKKEEKEENNDPEEDNKEEKDSEEEKREKESQKVALTNINNHISWDIFQELLPKLYSTTEFNALATITLDVPLYVLYACLKLNC